ncbi:MAG: glycerophosphodiester phosphodiesterase family protein [Candidatus Poribacteria bacterium]|nr:glycerophosphodiester phosphodiesterase family protein [Candidatus Poribacteria bacterium]
MTITGHRGAAKLEPENTLRSIQKAIELGVDQIEIDVHLTRDQHLVVIHDATVDRTTDGHGAVADFTLEEIKQLDAGKGERIPTLQEVINLVRGKVILQIELKGPGTAEPVVRGVEQNSIENEVVLTSFVHDRLHDAHRLNPSLALGALWSKPPADACEQAIEMGAEALHIQHQQIDADLVQKAHAHGLQIRAWNPDTTEEMQRVIDLGVDAVGSNRPDLLIGIGR